MEIRLKKGLLPSHLSGKRWKIASGNTGTRHALMPLVIPALVSTTHCANMIQSKYVSKEIGPVISTTTKTPAPASKAPPPSQSAKPPKSKPIPVPVKPTPAASKKPAPSQSESPPPASSSSSSAEPSISVSASPSCSANATETKKKPCIATQWLAERGLMSRALRHSTGTAEVLCINSSGLPCGTPGHLLRESRTGLLRSYAEICSVKDCISTSVAVSQLSHQYDWSIFGENGLQLTALSAHPDSTTYSPSRIVARLADNLNEMGLGLISNFFALVPHYASDAVTYAGFSSVLSS